MNIEEMVIKNYEKLNDTDLYIWQYILENKNEVSGLTISKLSKKISVSSTTIVRFVNKIGLNGYSELKFLVKQELEKDQLPQSNDFEKTCNSIVKYVNELKEKDYRKICKITDEAKKLFVWGSGDIQESVAEHLSRLFLSSGELMYTIKGNNVDKEVFNLIGKDDAIFLISLSGESKHVINLAEKLKIRGVKIISITEFKDNKLSSMSEESLYVRSSQINFSKSYPNYKTTSLFYVLAELLVIKYRDYKNKVWKIFTSCGKYFS